MNQKTAHLLHAYSRVTNKPLPVVKREWNSTPRDQRGDVRKEMTGGLWSTQLREFRKRTGLLQKEAADWLGVSLDTYRGWELMKGTPARYIRLALAARMKEWKGNA